MITWKKYLTKINESLSDDLHKVQDFINALAEKGDTVLGAMLDYLHEQGHLSQFIELAFRASQEGNARLLQEPVEQWLREFSEDPQAKIGMYYPNAYATFKIGAKGQDSYLTIKWVGRSERLEFSYADDRKGYYPSLSWSRKIHDEENSHQNGWSSSEAYYGENLDMKDLIDLSILLVILGSIRKK
jgi:hypothetical protein